MIDGATVTVKDYGASGDGVTDDTASIQAAINGMPDNGGILFFPQGTYKVTSSLTVPSIGQEFGNHVLKPISFMGESIPNNPGALGLLSDGPTVISYTGSGAMFDLMLGTGATAFFDGSFVDIGIIGDGTTAGTRAIKAYSLTRNAIFQNLMIRGFEENILIEGDCYSSTFINIRLQRAAVHNLHVKGIMNHVSFFNCLFDIAQDSCVHLERIGSGVNFYGCYFENAGAGGAGYGLEVGGPSLGGGFGALNLHGCYLESNWQDIFVQSGTTANESCTVNLTGCWIYPYSKQATSASITVDGPINLIGNTFNDGQSTGLGLINRAGATTPPVFATGNKTDETTQSMPLLFLGRDNYGMVTAINDGLAKDDDLTSYGAGLDTYLGANAAFANSDNSSTNIPLTLVQRNRTEEIIKIQSRSESGAINRTLVDEGLVTTATRKGFIKVRVEDETNIIADGDYYIPFFTLA